MQHSLKGQEQDLQPEKGSMKPDTEGGFLKTTHAVHKRWLFFGIPLLKASSPFFR